ncbi:RelA/SpoT family protein, partial [Pseudomonadota bacterium]
RSAFDSIQDIYAFRVIVDSVEDCYRALGVIHNLYKPIPGRFKDFIAIPKVNGYQSLHTLVFGTFGESFEVQIRTEPMHRIAEVGVASHWQYKTDKSSKFEPTEVARKWLLDLLETQPQAGSNPGDFLEHLKIDLFPDAVYVFTPKGDIKKLPQGATALDFAYAVHSDVGNRCVGARVNHTMVPLHTVLSSGDHIETLTSRSAHPTPSWLKFAMTSKARAAIRSYLKKQQGKDSIRLGKRLLDRELKALGWSRRKIGPKQRSSLLESLKLESWDDLLVDIGLGNRLPNVVARQLVPSGGEATDIDGSKPQPLEIHGAEGMLISYARCCRPIPGDSVIGFLTTGRGITVHTSDCPNIGEYRKHPDKWLHITWADDIDGEYPVNIRADAENRRGVLADLAATIAEQGSNIENITTVERDSFSSTLNFTIGVKNRISLAQILRQLRRKEGVLRIGRVKG